VLVEAPPQLLQPLVQVLQPESQQASQLDFFLNSLDRSPPLFFLHPLSHPQGSQAVISQPQVGAAPQPQLVSQQLSQPFLPARPIRPRSSISGLRRAGLQQLSHDAGSQQAFISQPQLGAAPQADPQGSQALISQPQDGFFSLLNKPPFLAQGSQAAISQPQLGAAPQADPQGSQALISHPQDGFFSLLNKPPFLAHGSQAAISQPQLGAAPQDEPQGSQALISHPQDGFFSLLNKPPFFAHGSAQGSQALISQPQVGPAPHPLSQHALSQPAPFRPSMRSSSPPPKLGVHRLAPSIRDPINMFHFIDFNSLNDELFSWRGWPNWGCGRDRFRRTKSSPKSLSNHLATNKRDAGSRLECSTSCAADSNHKGKLGYC
jgi:hypothetical protein